MTLTYIICLCLPPFLFDGAALHCPKETPFERFTNLFHEKAPIRYHTNNFLIYEVYELESLCLWKSVSKSIQNNFPSFWTIRDHIISEINSSLPSINTSNTLRFQNGSESVKCVSVLSGLTSLSTQLHPILYQIQRLYKQRGCHARIQQQYDMNEMDDVKLRRFFSNNISLIDLLLCQCHNNFATLFHPLPSIQGIIHCLLPSCANKHHNTCYTLHLIRSEQTDWIDWGFSYLSRGIYIEIQMDNIARQCSFLPRAANKEIRPTLI